MGVGSHCGGGEVRVNVWLDDVRPAPPGWTWARTAAEARAALERPCDIISLDHDLGTRETGADVAQWMTSVGRVPPVVCVHSTNPAGHARIVWIIEEYMHARGVECSQYAVTEPRTGLYCTVIESAS